MMLIIFQVADYNPPGTEHDMDIVDQQDDEVIDDVWNTICGNK